MNVYKTDYRLNEKAQQLCEKIYLAAKKSKTRRFHQLYDKVYRKDILYDSWNIVKQNKGCAGVDEMKISDVILYGQDKYLQELHELLLDTHKYHPRKIKRVYIPKADGKQRPLGIPAVKDRIVQTATKTLLEPIFEADFLDCSYGFRPNRSAHQAVEEIRVWTNNGLRFVLDADIKGYFDNINHETLLELVAQRISDKKILKLIRKWLKCGVVGELDNKVGTPQGGVISPLLANIYLHELDKFWLGQTRIRGKLIRYADDFVILFATKEEAELGLKLVKSQLMRLGLELNEKKSKIVDLKQGKEGFDFLGFHIHRVKSRKYKKHFTQRWPSVTAMKRIRQKIREKINHRSISNLSIEEVVKLINPTLRGWMNYFRYGNSGRKFAQIDSYVQERLNIWFRKKHKIRDTFWTRDFNREAYLKSGVQVLSGNVTYWKSNA
jgi:RNA-directed DNA polymerase